MVHAASSDSTTVVTYITNKLAEFLTDTPAQQAAFLASLGLDMTTLMSLGLSLDQIAAYIATNSQSIIAYLTSQGSQIFNCAVDSLGNLIGAGTDKNGLAENIILVDIMTGSLSVQASQGLNDPIQFSALAIQQTAALYGIKLTGFSTDITGLTQAAAGGKPVVVQVTNSSGQGHFVVVTSITNGIVTYKDNDGTVKTMKVADFQNVWSGVILSQDQIAGDNVSRLSLLQTQQIMGASGNPITYVVRGLNAAGSYVVHTVTHAIAHPLDTIKTVQADISKVQDDIVAVAKKTWDIAGKVWTGITSKSTYQAIGTWIKHAADTIHHGTVETFKATWKLTKAIGNFFAAFGDLFTGDWSGFKSRMGGAWTNLTQSVGQVLSGAAEIVVGSIAITSIVAPLAVGIARACGSNWMNNNWNGIVKYGKGVVIVVAAIIIIYFTGGAGATVFGSTMLASACAATAVAVAVSVSAQMAFNHGNINYNQLGKTAVIAFASSIAMAGAGTLGQASTFWGQVAVSAARGAVIAGVTNIGSQLITTGHINWTKVALAVGIGAAQGAANGAMNYEVRISPSLQASSWYTAAWEGAVRGAVNSFISDMITEGIYDRKLHGYRILRDMGEGGVKGGVEGSLQGADDGKGGRTGGLFSKLNQSSDVAGKIFAGTFSGFATGTADYFAKCLIEWQAPDANGIKGAMMGGMFNGLISTALATRTYVPGGAPQPGSAYGIDGWLNGDNTLGFVVGTVLNTAGSFLASYISGAAVFYSTAGARGSYNDYLRGTDDGATGNRFEVMMAGSVEQALTSSIAESFARFDEAHVKYFEGKSLADHVNNLVGDETYKDPKTGTIYHSDAYIDFDARSGSFFIIAGHVDYKTPSGSVVTATYEDGGIVKAGDDTFNDYTALGNRYCGFALVPTTSDDQRVILLSGPIDAPTFVNGYDTPTYRLGLSANGKLSDLLTFNGSNGWSVDLQVNERSAQSPIPGKIFVTRAEDGSFNVFSLDPETGNPVDAGTISEDQLKESHGRVKLAGRLDGTAAEAVTTDLLGHTITRQDKFDAGDIIIHITPDAAGGGFVASFKGEVENAKIKGDYVHVTYGGGKFYALDGDAAEVGIANADNNLDLKGQGDGAIARVRGARRPVTTTDEGTDDLAAALDEILPGDGPATDGNTGESGGHIRATIRKSATPSAPAPDAGTPDGQPQPAPEATPSAPVPPVVRTDGVLALANTQGSTGIDPVSDLLDQLFPTPVTEGGPVNDQPPVTKNDANAPFEPLPGENTGDGSGAPTIVPHALRQVTPARSATADEDQPPVPPAETNPGAVPPAVENGGVLALGSPTSNLDAANIVDQLLTLAPAADTLPDQPPAAKDDTPPSAETLPGDKPGNGDSGPLTPHVLRQAPPAPTATTGEPPQPIVPDQPFVDGPIPDSVKTDGVMAFGNPGGNGDLLSYVEDQVVTTPPVSGGPAPVADTAEDQPPKDKDVVPPSAGPLPGDNAGAGESGPITAHAFKQTTPMRTPDAGEPPQLVLPDETLFGPDVPDTVKTDGVLGVGNPGGNGGLISYVEDAVVTPPVSAGPAPVSDAPEEPPTPPEAAPRAPEQLAMGPAGVLPPVGTQPSGLNTAPPPIAGSGSDEELMNAAVDDHSDTFTDETLTHADVRLKVTRGSDGTISVSYVGLVNASIDGVPQTIYYGPTGMAYAFDNPTLAGAAANGGRLVLKNQAPGMGVHHVGPLDDNGNADTSDDTLTGGDLVLRVSANNDGTFGVRFGGVENARIGGSDQTLCFRPDGAAFSLDNSFLEKYHGSSITLNDQATGFGVRTANGDKTLTGGDMVLRLSGSGPDGFNVRFAGFDGAEIDGVAFKTCQMTNGSYYAFNNTSMADAFDNNKGMLVLKDDGKGFGVEKVGALVNGKAVATSETLTAGDSAFKVTKNYDGTFDVRFATIQNAKIGDVSETLAFGRPDGVVYALNDDLLQEVIPHGKDHGNLVIADQGKGFAVQLAGPVGADGRSTVTSGKLSGGDAVLTISIAADGVYGVRFTDIINADVNGVDQKIYFGPDGTAYGLDRSVVAAAEQKHDGILILAGQANGLSVKNVGPANGKGEAGVTDEKLTGGDLVLYVGDKSFDTCDVRLAGVQNGDLDGEHVNIMFKPDGTAYAFDTAAILASKQHDGILMLAGEAAGFKVREVGAVVDGHASFSTDLLTSGDLGVKVSFDPKGGEPEVRLAGIITNAEIATKIQTDIKQTIIFANDGTAYAFTDAALAEAKANRDSAAFNNLPAVVMLRQMGILGDNTNAHFGITIDGGASDYAVQIVGKSGMTKSSLLGGDMVLEIAEKNDSYAAQVSGINNALTQDHTSVKVFLFGNNAYALLPELDLPDAKNVMVDSQGNLVVMSQDQAGKASAVLIDHEGNQTAIKDVYADNAWITTGLKAAGIGEDVNGLMLIYKAVRGKDGAPDKWVSMFVHPVGDGYFAELQKYTCNDGSVIFESQGKSRSLYKVNTSADGTQSLGFILSGSYSSTSEGDTVRKQFDVNAKDGSVTSDLYVQRGAAGLSDDVFKDKYGTILNEVKIKGILKSDSEGFIAKTVSGYGLEFKGDDVVGAFTGDLDVKNGKSKIHYSFGSDGMYLGSVVTTTRAIPGTAAYYVTTVTYDYDDKKSAPVSVLKGNMGITGIYTDPTGKQYISGTLVIDKETGRIDVANGVGRRTEQGILVEFTTDKNGRERVVRTYGPTGIDTDVRAQNSYTTYANGRSYDHTQNASGFGNFTTPDGSVYTSGNVIVVNGELRVGDGDCTSFMGKGSLALTGKSDSQGNASYSWISGTYHGKALNTELVPLSGGGYQIFDATIFNGDWFSSVDGMTDIDFTMVGLKQVTVGTKENAKQVWMFEVGIIGKQDQDFNGVNMPRQGVAGGNTIAPVPSGEESEFGLQRELLVTTGDYNRFTKSATINITATSGNVAFKADIPVDSAQDGHIKSLTFSGFEEGTRVRMGKGGLQYETQYAGQGLLASGYRDITEGTYIDIHIPGSLDANMAYTIGTVNDHFTLTAMSNPNGTGKSLGDITVLDRTFVDGKITSYVSSSSSDDVFYGEYTVGTVRVDLKSAGFASTNISPFTAAGGHLLGAVANGVGAVWNGLLAAWYTYKSDSVSAKQAEEMSSLMGAAAIGDAVGFINSLGKIGESIGDSAAILAQAFNSWTSNWSNWYEGDNAAEVKAYHMSQLRNDGIISTVVGLSIGLKDAAKGFSYALVGGIASKFGSGWGVETLAEGQLLFRESSVVEGAIKGATVGWGVVTNVSSRVWGGVLFLGGMLNMAYAEYDNFKRALKVSIYNALMNGTFAFNMDVDLNDENAQAGHDWITEGTNRIYGEKNLSDDSFALRSSARLWVSTAFVAVLVTGAIMAIEAVATAATSAVTSTGSMIKAGSSLLNAGRIVLSDALTGAYTNAIVDTGLRIVKGEDVTVGTIVSAFVSGAILAGGMSLGGRLAGFVANNVKFGVQAATQTLAEGAAVYAKSGGLFASIGEQSLVKAGSITEIGAILTARVFNSLSIWVAGAIGKLGALAAKGEKFVTAEAIWGMAKSAPLFTSIEIVAGIGYRTLFKGMSYDSALADLGGYNGIATKFLTQPLEFAAMGITLGFMMQVFQASNLVTRAFFGNRTFGPALELFSTRHTFGNLFDSISVLFGTKTAAEISEMMLQNLAKEGGAGIAFIGHAESAAFTAASLWLGEQAGYIVGRQLGLKGRDLEKFASDVAFYSLMFIPKSTADPSYAVHEVLSRRVIDAAGRSEEGIQGLQVALALAPDAAAARDVLRRYDPTLNKDSLTPELVDHLQTKLSETSARDIIVLGSVDAAGAQAKANEVLLAKDGTKVDGYVVTEALKRAAIDLTIEGARESVSAEIAGMGLHTGDPERAIDECLERLGSIVQDKSNPIRSLAAIAIGREWSDLKTAVGRLDMLAGTNLDMAAKIRELYQEWTTSLLTGEPLENNADLAQLVSEVFKLASEKTRIALTAKIDKATDPKVVRDLTQQLNNLTEAEKSTDFASQLAVFHTDMFLVADRVVDFDRKPLIDRIVDNAKDWKRQSDSDRLKALSNYIESVYRESGVKLSQKQRTLVFELNDKLKRGEDLTEADLQDIAACESLRPEKAGGAKWGDSTPKQRVESLVKYLDDAMPLNIEQRARIDALIKKGGSLTELERAEVLDLESRRAAEMLGIILGDRIREVGTKNFTAEQKTRLSELMRKSGESGLTAEELYEYKRLETLMEYNLPSGFGTAAVTLGDFYEGQYDAFASIFKAMINGEKMEGDTLSRYAHQLRTAGGKTVIGLFTEMLLATSKTATNKCIGWLTNTDANARDLGAHSRIIFGNSLGRVLVLDGVTLERMKNNGTLRTELEKADIIITTYNSMSSLYSSSMAKLISYADTDAKGKEIAEHNIALLKTAEPPILTSKDANGKIQLANAADSRRAIEWLAKNGGLGLGETDLPLTRLGDLIADELDYLGTIPMSALASSTGKYYTTARPVEYYAELMRIKETNRSLSDDLVRTLLEKFADMGLSEQMLRIDFGAPETLKGKMEFYETLSGEVERATTKAKGEDGKVTDRSVLSDADINSLVDRLSDRAKELGLDVAEVRKMVVTQIDNLCKDSYVRNFLAPKLLDLAMRTQAPDKGMSTIKGNRSAETNPVDKDPRDPRAMGQDRRMGGILVDGKLVETVDPATKPDTETPKAETKGHIAPDKLKGEIDALVDQVLSKFGNLFNEREIREQISGGMSAAEMFLKTGMEYDPKTGKYKKREGGARVGEGSYTVQGEGDSRRIIITNDGKGVENLTLPGMAVLEALEHITNLTRPTKETFVSNSVEAMNAWGNIVGFSGTYSDSIKGLLKTMEFTEGGAAPTGVKVGIYSVLTTTQEAIAKVITEAVKTVERSGRASINLILTSGSHATDLMVEELRKNGVAEDDIVSLTLTNINQQLYKYGQKIEAMREAIRFAATDEARVVAERSYNAYIKGSELTDTDITKITSQANIADISLDEKTSLLTKVLSGETKTGSAKYVIGDAYLLGRGWSVGRMGDAANNLKDSFFKSYTPENADLQLSQFGEKMREMRSAIENATTPKEKDAAETAYKSFVKAAKLTDVEIATIDAPESITKLSDADKKDLLVKLLKTDLVQATMWLVNVDKFTATQLEQGLGRFDHYGDSRFDREFFNKEIVQITSVESARESVTLREAAKTNRGWNIDLIINNMKDVMTANEKASLEKAGQKVLTSASTEKADSKPVSPIEALGRLPESERKTVKDGLDTTPGMTYHAGGVAWLTAKGQTYISNVAALRNGAVPSGSQVVLSPMNTALVAFFGAADILGFEQVSVIKGLELTDNTPMAVSIALYLAKSGLSLSAIVDIGIALPVLNTGGVTIASADIKAALAYRYPPDVTQIMAHYGVALPPAAVYKLLQPNAGKLPAPVKKQIAVIEKAIAVTEKLKDSGSDNVLKKLYRGLFTARPINVLKKQQKMSFAEIIELAQETTGAGGKTPAIAEVIQSPDFALLAALLGVSDACKVTGVLQSLNNLGLSGQFNVLKPAEIMAYLAGHITSTDLISKLSLGKPKSLPIRMINSLVERLHLLAAYGSSLLGVDLNATPVDILNRPVNLRIGDAAKYLKEIQGQSVQQATQAELMKGLGAIGQGPDAMAKLQQVQADAAAAAQKNFSFTMADIIAVAEKNGLSDEQVLSIVNISFSKEDRAKVLSFYKSAQYIPGYGPQFAATLTLAQLSDPQFDMDKAYKPFGDSYVQVHKKENGEFGGSLVGALDNFIGNGKGTGAAHTGKSADQLIKEFLETPAGYAAKATLLDYLRSKGMQIAAAALTSGLTGSTVLNPHVEAALKQLDIVGQVISDAVDPNDKEKAAKPKAPGKPISENVKQMIVQLQDIIQLAASYGINDLSPEDILDVLKAAYPAGVAEKFQQNGLSLPPAPVLSLLRLMGARSTGLKGNLPTIIAKYDEAIAAVTKEVEPPSTTARAIKAIRKGQNISVQELLTMATTLASGKDAANASAAPKSIAVVATLFGIKNVNSVAAVVEGLKARGVDLDLIDLSQLNSYLDGETPSLDFVSRQADGTINGSVAQLINSLLDMIYGTFRLPVSLKNKLFIGGGIIGKGGNYDLHVVTNSLKDIRDEALSPRVKAAIAKDPEATKDRTALWARERKNYQFTVADIANAAAQNRVPPEIILSILNISLTPQERQLAVKNIKAVQRLPEGIEFANTLTLAEITDPKFTDVSAQKTLLARKHIQQLPDGTFTGSLVAALDGYIGNGSQQLSISPAVITRLIAEYLASSQEAFAGKQTIINFVMSRLGALDKPAAATALTPAQRSMSKARINALGEFTDGISSIDEAVALAKPAMPMAAIKPVTVDLKHVLTKSRELAPLYKAAITAQTRYNAVVGDKPVTPEQISKAKAEWEAAEKAKDPKADSLKAEFKNLELTFTTQQAVNTEYKNAVDAYYAARNKYQNATEAPAIDVAAAPAPTVAEPAVTPVVAASRVPSAKLKASIEDQMAARSNKAPKAKVATAEKPSVAPVQAVAAAAPSAAQAITRTVAASGLTATVAQQLAAKSKSADKAAPAPVILASNRHAAAPVAQAEPPVTSASPALLPASEASPLTATIAEQLSAKAPQKGLITTKGRSAKKSQSELAVHNLGLEAERVMVGPLPGIPDLTGLATVAAKEIETRAGRLLEDRVNKAVVDRLVKHVEELVTAKNGIAGEPFTDPAVGTGYSFPKNDKWEMFAFDMTMLAGGEDNVPAKIESIVSKHALAEKLLFAFGENDEKNSISAHFATRSLTVGEATHTYLIIVRESVDPIGPANYEAVAKIQEKLWSGKVIDTKFGNSPFWMANYGVLKDGRVVLVNPDVLAQIDPVANGQGNVPLPSLIPMNPEIAGLAQGPNYNVFGRGDMHRDPLGDAARRAAKYFTGDQGSDKNNLNRMFKLAA